jgi:hypothetical protein
MKLRRLSWMENFRWAMNAMRIRRIRYDLTFSQRIAFDAELRPHVQGGRIAYPDALYHVTVGDIIRALRAAHGLPT